MPVEIFSPPYSQEAVQDLRTRLERSRWVEPMAGAGWTEGCDAVFLRDLCRYWASEFDWKAQVERMSAFPNFRFTTGGTAIHFTHQRGRGPRPLPLILTHGWPGSFLEMLKIIPLLTDPAAHGADPSDSFDVVVPSLPGYGYSDPPREPGTNTSRTADLWAALMRELGYERFAAQGGDIGASVTTLLGLRHANRIVGIHLNYAPGSYRPWISSGEILTPPEQEFLDSEARWRDECYAYGHLQGTRPVTAAYGLNDSPAALAAWIVEKFVEWSDCGGDVYTRFSKDELLANVTLYWMTQSIYSSFRMYWEGRRAPLRFSAGQRVSVPCGFAHFPREMPFPPREWVERGYNVRRWTEMPRGGHFPAAEEPQLLAEDLRAFFRPLRE